MEQTPAEALTAFNDKNIDISEINLIQIELGDENEVNFNVGFHPSTEYITKSVLTITLKELNDETIHYMVSLFKQYFLYYSKEEIVYDFYEDGTINFHPDKKLSALTKTFSVESKLVELIDIETMLEKEKRLWKK